ncbi:MAG TPA: hypothetical protein VFR17_07950 [Mycobacterium sp.]|nr:hypothetical protein [Mycobacterium sp.]
MPSDEPDPRVDALEAQVHKLTDRVRASEQDVAAARILAGAADRDVDEFRGELRGIRGEMHDIRGEVHDIRGEMRGFRRATTASFNALRADMTDLRGEFTDLRTHVDNGFTEMRGKFDATAAGQQHIVDLLEGLIADQS